MTSRTYGSEGGIEFLSNQDPVSYLTRALAIYVQKLGTDHPRTTRVRENYANLLQEMKQKTEAARAKPKVPP